SAAAVAARVRASAVRSRLVAALDDWAGVTADPRRLTWLLEAARRADPNPLRDRLRDAAAWGNDRALLQLVEEATRHADELPAPLLSALCTRLPPTEAVNLA